MPRLPIPLLFLPFLFLLLAGCRTGFDADGDGFESVAAGGKDCDDRDATVHPDADETCDGVDNDCDGAIDGNDAIDAAAWFFDGDGDGFGDPAESTYSCVRPLHFVTDATDCDDSQASTHPGATETCDGADEDCDGTIDEDPTDVWYADADADGYGDATDSLTACAPPEGYVANANDCDDANPALNPETTWYIDYDGDGHGSDAYTRQQCERPAGYLGNADDCDDSVASTYPDAIEYCDGIDHDCDGSADEPESVDALTWYADSDGDGFGLPSAMIEACDAPANHVADALDCDDTRMAIHPGATEFCDGLDNNCDGDIDEATASDAVTWYVDADGDGYGVFTSTLVSCLAPAGYAANPTDCNDGDSRVNPDTIEVCDSADIDEDCNGAADDVDVSASGRSNWYRDRDIDGFGDVSSFQTTCDPPAGFVADATDCDDADPSVNRDALEICDGRDDDCDESVDEDDSLDAATWYADSDADGYGDAAVFTFACSPPAGFVADATDCDDTLASLNPGVTEVPTNGRDDDCDGHDALIVQVEGGANHALGLDELGHVWAWGANSDGQLGDGTTTDRCFPVLVNGLSGVTAIAAGNWYSVALLEDGTVRVWGEWIWNDTAMHSSSPVAVEGLSEVGAIAAGEYHTLALLDDGTVRAWGDNTSNQLGNGTGGASTSPVTPSDLAGVVGIAAGRSHSLALLGDGTVRAWGYNSSGQLGDGTTIRSPIPIAVPGLSGVVEIGAGYAHSMALLGDGTVRAWGDNFAGQVGDGTTTNRTSPVTVSSLSGVVDIAAGSGWSLALPSDGTVRAWGDNPFGQLGNGTTNDASTPVVVPGLYHVAAIATGGWFFQWGFSLALLDDGTVRAWGINPGGQLGIGMTTASSNEPVSVNGLTGVTAVTGGGYHSLVIEYGIVEAWGGNWHGQLGDGTATSSSAPRWATGFGTWFVDVAAGEWHSLALLDDGTAWAWGYGGDGQLGDGSTDDSSIPVQVSGPTDVVAIAAGKYHSLALLGDGTVQAWGRNGDGQLGDGTTINASTPIVVEGLAGAVVGIAAGERHSLALLDDGTLLAWGDNQFGQLGDGTMIDSPNPVAVSGPTGGIAVAAGDDHSLALLDDGTVQAWGYNGSGQLGDGTRTLSSTPVGVQGLSDVVEIAAGGWGHSLALIADGTVRAWGGNDYGQLGDGTTTDSPIPVTVSGLADVVAIAAGEYHSLAVLDDGNVQAWGDNLHGQLGFDTWTPQVVVFP